MENQTFEQFFLLRNPKHEFLLRYMRTALGVDEIKYEHFTTTNMQTFKNYLDGKVTNNSMKTYFAILAATCRLLVEDGLIKSAKCLTSLRTKPTPQQNVALTEDEIHKLEDYYDHLMRLSKHQTEKDVMTLFMLELYCGARGSDVEELSQKNLQDGKLTYISKKTHIMATIPQHHRLAEMLKRKPTNKFCASTKNRVVKRVCKKCGITQTVTLLYHGSMMTKPKYEFVGFHTARRSFASALAARGVPVAEISQYMGHCSQSMTERYIKVDSRQVSPEAMSFFNS